MLDRMDEDQINVEQGDSNGEKKNEDVMNTDKKQKRTKRGRRRRSTPQKLKRQSNVEQGDSNGEKKNEDVMNTDKKQKRTKRGRRRRSITPRKLKRQSNFFMDELSRFNLDPDLYSLIFVMKKKTASYSRSTKLHDFTEEFIKEMRASCKNLEPLFNFTIEDLVSFGITLGLHIRLIFHTRDKIKERSLISTYEKSLILENLRKYTEITNEQINVINIRLDKLIDIME